MFPNRVLSREVGLDDDLVDDRYLRRCRNVALFDTTAQEQRNFHGSEEGRRDRNEGDTGLLARIARDGHAG